MTAPELIANRYRCERELGVGAMGRVLLVEDTATGEAVALKVILAEREPGLSDTVGLLVPTPEGAQRSLLQFKQEFRLMSQLHHPNCCQVFDYGQLPDGAPYFTMEVVPGHGLDELLEQARTRAGAGLAPEWVKGVLAQLLLALGYLHQLGYVHCDLKPANVRVRPDGVLKLMDYGLMELAGRPTSTIRGTLPYMCPEMIRRGPIDQRSDLYALGCLAYELLTGSAPFVRERALDVLRAHIQDEPVALGVMRPEVDPVLSTWIMRCLAKEPLDRPQSADEVLEALGTEPSAGIGGTLLASPLMGRDVEMKALLEQLAGVRKSGLGKLVTLSGPSGIGKTRLLEEFRCHVQLEGLPYAVGSCHDLTREPYAPFVTLFHRLVPLARELAPAILAQEAPVLIKLLPELGTSLATPVVPAPDLDTGKQEALRLHASLGALLAAIAAHGPLVLALEDWHWADPSSRELAHALRRNAAQLPVLWLVTSREEILDEAPTATIFDLPLSALDADGLRRLVASMLGTDGVDPAFLRELAELTAGNPFFVERLLEHLVQQGRLRRDHGHWETHVSLRGELPATLKALLLEKLALLEPGALQVARALAVIGRPTPLELLQRATGLADEPLIVAIHELGMAKLLGQDAHGRVSFAQAQIAEALYGSLDDGARRALHTTLFRVLDASLGPRALSELPLEVLTEVARHGLGGDRPPRAVAYVLAAGERHARLFALEDAERLLETGLELLNATALADQRLPHFAFLRALGEVKRQTGRAGEAAGLLEAALKLALDRPRLTGPIPPTGAGPGESLIPPAEVGRLLTSLAKCYQLEGNLDRARSIAGRSLEACRAAGDPAGAARAALTVARIRFYQGQASAAVEDAEAALTLAQQSHEKSINGMAHAFLGYLYVSTRPDKLGAGVQHLHASLKLLVQAGDRPGLNDSYNLLGNAETMLGNFRAATQAFRESRKICREIGFQADEAVALVNLAQTAIELGDWPEALHLAIEARTLSEALDASLPLGMALSLQATALAQLGPLAEAAPLAERAVALARARANLYLESLVLAQALDVLLALGRLTETQATLAALAQTISDTGNQECLGRLQAARAELAARQGLYGTAREHADEALATATASGAKGLQLQARTTKARIQALAGNWSEARSLAREALTIAEHLGCHARRAELFEVLGEAALAQGESDAAGYFAAMLEAAELTAAPGLRAQALFGRAAAHAHAATSELEARRASELLLQLTADLSESERTDYMAARERRRVMDGDFAAFGQAVRKPTGTPLGLRFGGGLDL